jgi:hypothetical protein
VGGIVRGFWLVGNPLVHSGRLQCYSFLEREGGGDSVNYSHVGVFRFHFRSGFDGYPVS